MRYRQLGNSELLLSEIGMGTWAIGGGDWGMGWGNQTEEDSKDAIIEALEEGINWIDTAHAYGFGVAEQIIGEVLSEWKEDVIIATKCGVLAEEGNKPVRFISPTSIRKEIEGSLKRLKREVIDLYQIHWPVPLENLHDSWETLLDLKTQGKIRSIGVCNCFLQELSLLGDPEVITSNQPMYSLLERTIEDEVIPWCDENKVGLLAYSPMQSGLLTGKVSRQWLDSLPLNDWRKHKVEHPVVSPIHGKENLSRFLAFQSDLSDIAKLSDRSVGQLAVAWVLRRSEVSSAIVGARKAGQIKEICSVSEKPLSSEEIDAVNQSLYRYESTV
jgi:aryl-alcohol dehydrogenase-like predicted oxidoreductase